MLNISNLYPNTAISNKNKDTKVTILENSNQFSLDNVNN